MNLPIALLLALVYWHLLLLLTVEVVFTTNIISSITLGPQVPRTTPLYQVLGNRVKDRQPHIPALVTLKVRTGRSETSECIFVPIIIARGLLSFMFT